MFTKLLHGLTSTIGRIKQLWTKENVPAQASTLHDFRDGDGWVPAAPVDEGGVNNRIATTGEYLVHCDSQSVMNRLRGILPFDIYFSTASVCNRTSITIDYPVNTHIASVANRIVAVDAE